MDERILFLYIDLFKLWLNFKIEYYQLLNNNVYQNGHFLQYEGNFELEMKQTKGSFVFIMIFATNDYFREKLPLLSFDLNYLQKLSDITFSKHKKSKKHDFIQPQKSVLYFLFWSI